MDLKKPYTLDEQIKKLKDHGVVISDDERKQLRDKLNRIVKKYEKDIDLNLIGFPQNYRELMYIKNLKNIT